MCIGNLAKKIIGERPDESMPLLQAGCTSLGAVRFAKMLGVILSMSLPATLIFNYPTITAIAGYVT